MRHILARNKALQWNKSYVLPEFPYDVKCMLAEQKCPDHSMRIRIIEFLQADLTKYLEGSLWVITGQTCCLARGRVFRIDLKSFGTHSLQILHDRLIISPALPNIWMCVLCSVVSDSSVTPWTVAHQAPLSVGFSRREYWSGLPFPPPGDLPNPGTEPRSPVSPALQTDSLPLSHQESPYLSVYIIT